MSEFQIKQHAERSPTVCALCQTHEGPFVDCGQEMPVHGWLYVCVGSEERPGCLIQMARLVGMAETSDHAAVLDRAEFLAAKVDELRAELAAKEDHVVVSVSDLKQLVGKR